MKKTLKIGFILGIVFVSLFWLSKNTNINPSHSVGDIVDSLNGVNVYYNGGVSNVEHRNTSDGYNLGLKYQCVEFVKRYYYENYNHKMPDTYGNAIDFFNSALSDGKINSQRALTQFTNPSISKPRIGDLIVMSGTIFNKYGHVAIVSNVTDENIEIIQQNPGPFSNSRELFGLTKTEGYWEIKNDRVMGWLRK